MVVLEDYEHAKARGAKIYAEIVGYGANSDGHDMVAPSGEGAQRCMKLALDGFSGNGLEMPVDYINAHGTSTPVRDVKELEAVQAVFGPRGYLPVVTSTKSLTGHSLGATGVQRSNLYLADDAEQLYRGFCQYRKSGSGNWRYSNTASAYGK